MLKVVQRGRPNVGKAAELYARESPVDSLPFDVRAQNLDESVIAYDLRIPRQGVVILKPDGREMHSVEPREVHCYHPFVLNHKSKLIQ